MLKRLLPLIVIVFFIPGCQICWEAAPTPEPFVEVKTAKTRVLPAYTHVLVNGALNVTLHTGAAQSRVVLRGNSLDLVQISTRVVNNTLVVQPNGGYPKAPVTVHVYTRYLNDFTYKGSGEIKGSDIHSGLLNLNISNPGRTRLSGDIRLHRLEVDGPGYTEIHGVNTNGLQLKLSGQAKVQLAGIANLSTLDLDGDGWFGMYWVKSNNLTVRAKGHTFIQLAGIADKLDVELWGYAHFNGRYLRSKTIFAKTHNHSLAEITTLDRQHTLATDASDIYYYEKPEMRADFMADNGSVLNMEGWNPDAVVKDYTRYNK